MRPGDVPLQFNLSFLILISLKPRNSITYYPDLLFKEISYFFPFQRNRERDRQTNTDTDRCEYIYIYIYTLKKTSGEKEKSRNHILPNTSSTERYNALEILIYFESFHVSLVGKIFHSYPIPYSSTFL